MSSLIAIGTPASGLSAVSDIASACSQGLLADRHPEGVQPAVDRLDPAQAELDELARAQLVPANHVRERARPGERELLLGGGRHA